ncbi:MAG: hypothetical protein PVF58_19620 [Candidatus Methanofastidiosia archaeon]|jgi:hypothetical protein
MVCTKYFEIVGNVIESEIQGLISERNQKRRSIINEIAKHAKKMHDKYYDPAKPRNEFREPCCRIAYLYKYVTVNARAIEHIFYNSRELKKRILRIQKEKGEVGVCALGGGPGTELLGLSKWVERESLREDEFKIKFDFVNFDRVKQWGTSWKYMKNKIRDRFRKKFGISDIDWPFRCEGDFYPLDVDETQDYSNLAPYFSDDIYIISYFISEIYEISKNFRNLFNKIVSYAPDRSKFIFIERGETRWQPVIEGLANSANISIEGPFEKPDGRIPKRDGISENKRDLGPILDELESYHQSPCTTWNAFHYIGTKMELTSFI